MTAYPAYKDLTAAWISRLPSHWQAIPVKYVCSYNDDVLADSTDPLALISYVEISDVDETSGLKGSETMSFDAAPSRARRIVKDGDVLISTVRTYLRAVAPIKNPPPNLVVSTGFAVIRPEKILSGFARYALVADGFVGSLISRSTGVSYPAINASELVRIPIPVPPISEQGAIAEYLDTEMSRIDVLIEEKKRLFTYLEELLSACVRAAMLSCLGGVEFSSVRESPWLGLLPKHWKRMSLSRIVESACDGPFGSSLKSEHYTPDGIPVIRLQNIGNGVYLDAEPAFISEAYFEELGGHDARPGDLIVACLGDDRRSPGRCCVVPSKLSKALVKADCFRFRLNEELADAEFMAMFLNSLARQFFRFTAKGTTRQRVTISDVRRCIIALPPLDEQVTIVERVKREQHSIASLSEHLSSELMLLAELRSSTITDAVLGRIDARKYLQN